MQVDELEISIVAGPDATIAGTPWLSAIRAGVLDGAEIQLDRAFMVIMGLDHVDQFSDIVRHHEAGTVPPTARMLKTITAMMLPTHAAQV